VGPFILLWNPSSTFCLVLVSGPPLPLNSSPRGRLSLFSKGFLPKPLSPTLTPAVFGSLRCFGFSTYYFCGSNKTLPPILIFRSRLVPVLSPIDVSCFLVLALKSGVPCDWTTPWTFLRMTPPLFFFDSRQGSSFHGL